MEEVAALKAVASFASTSIFPIRRRRENRLEPSNTSRAAKRALSLGMLKEALYMAEREGKGLIGLYYGHHTPNP